MADNAAALEMTATERFERDPLNNDPPCLRQPGKTCLPECEAGIAGSCVREGLSGEQVLEPQPARGSE